ncbi:UNVERIFIED_CONTAM: hypothetical protein Sradi_3634000 [Sesamum radiatum]|uniref:Integrase catalytic domain-containing protein n=1 Tax=Sesamum radiatum TaxID=300843 RepID=A0AAW2QHP7_SESRA
MTRMPQEKAPEEGPWFLHLDGPSTTQGSGAGIVITFPHGEDMGFAIKFDFRASNNEVDVQAIALSNNDWRTPLIQWLDDEQLPRDMWEATKWGMDIVGQFPLASGQRKFLLVAIDYFTKWVEAERLTRIIERDVMKFIWKNIICHFGLPREIIFNNERQFQGRRMQEWCKELHIKQKFTWVSHPQANGQVEVTNHILVQGIKKRFDKVGGNWVEELVSVLWSCRTTPKGSTGESPFTLVYGTKAIIPDELEMPSHRVLHFSKEDNTKLLREHLELIEELREKAFIWT